MKARENAIIPITPAADHSGKEGYAVTTNGTTCAIVSSNASSAFGVIVRGYPTTGKDSVAAFSSGIPVKVKLAASAGTVVLGTKLKVHTDGTFAASDLGVGDVIGAIALEDGANNELIDAVLTDINKLVAGET